MSKPYKGKCSCGAVSYVAEGKPVVVAQCHCEACRRVSGTGHSIGAMFKSNSVTVEGTVSKFRYVSDMGSEVTKAFCPNCGSPIYGTNTNSPEYLTLTLGTMDNVDDLKVEVVIFESEKPQWDELGDDIVCFQTQPDWKPGG